MRAANDAATAAVHRFRPLSRPAAAMLAALLVLFIIGALPPAHGDRSTPAGPAVVLDDVATGSAALAIRSLRQLSTHPPASSLQPAPAAPPVPSAIVLLVAIGTPFWMLSRRSRQAYLLSSAGPGPPSHS